MDHPLDVKVLGAAEYLSLENKNVCVSDHDGTLLWRSSSSEHWLAALEEGKPLAVQLLPLLQESELWELIEVKCRQHQPLQTHLRLEGQPFLLKLTPMLGQQGEHYTIWVWEAAASLQDQMAALYQHSSLEREYREVFFYIFNHLKALDFRWNEAVSQETEDYQAAMEHMAQIRKFSYRLLRFHCNFSEYSKALQSKEDYRWEVLSLRGFLEELVSLCNLFFANPGKRLQLETEGEVMAVLADQKRLTVALLNLVHNALSFSHPDTPIRMKLHSSKSHVVCRIENSGSGIPAPYLAKVFEPFFSYDPCEEYSRRMGLGLTVTKQIIEQHGGQIMLTSQENGDTVVTVQLPKTDAHAMQNLTVESPIASMDDDFSLHRIFLSELR